MLSQTALIPHRTPSDTEILDAVRKGRRGMFRQLHDRHYKAVYAYALTCTSVPDAARQLTASAFLELRNHIDSPAPLNRGRYGECVRLQLLDYARMHAVQQSIDHPYYYTSAFLKWVHSGSLWPMREDAQLGETFDELTATERCLLWHALVERDTAPVIAVVTGLNEKDLAVRRALASHALRQRRMRLYLQRRECTDCFTAVGGPERLAYGPRDLQDYRAYALCARCKALCDELVQLDERLGQHLPPRLLGWWQADEYYGNKAALQKTAPPRATGILAATPGRRYQRRRRHAKRRCDASPLGRSLPTLLAVGAASGIAVLIALAASSAGPPSSEVSPLDTPTPRSQPSMETTSPVVSAAHRVHADEYSVSVGTIGPGADDTRARRLAGGTRLVFDGVDFGSSGEKRLTVRLSALSYRPAHVEFRLDDPDSAPWATVEVLSAGEPHNVSTFAPPTRGTHRVIATALCDTGRLCVELSWFQWAVD